MAELRGIYVRLGTMLKRLIPQSWNLESITRKFEQWLCECNDGLSPSSQVTSYGDNSYQVNSYRVNSYRVNSYQVNSYRVNSYWVNSYQVYSYRVKSYWVNLNQGIMRWPVLAGLAVLLIQLFRSGFGESSGNVYFSHPLITTGFIRFVLLLTVISYKETNEQFVEMVKHVCRALTESYFADLTQLKWGQVFKSCIVSKTKKRTMQWSTCE